MGFSIVRIEGIEGTAKPPNRPSNAIRPTTPGMTTRLSRLCSATMPTCPTIVTAETLGNFESYSHPSATGFLHPT